MSDSKENLPAFSWMDSLIQWGIVALLAPFWIPLFIYETIDVHCRLFWHLRGNVESAWSRCAQTWRRDSCVYGVESGAAMGLTLQHLLSVKFARYHRDAESFLRDKLREPNPYLAAYAFKCLIRYRHLILADVPEDVIKRKDKIYWLPFGCTAERIALHEFIKNYFQNRPSYY